MYDLVKFSTFLEEENKIDICCDTPKQDVTLRQELVISQSTKLRYDNTWSIKCFTINIQTSFFIFLSY